MHHLDKQLRVVTRSVPGPQGLPQTCLSWLTGDGPRTANQRGDFQGEGAENTEERAWAAQGGSLLARGQSSTSAEIQMMRNYSPALPTYRDHGIK